MRQLGEWRNLAGMEKMHYDIIEQFKTAILNAGIQFHGDIIADGKLHRFHVEGDRSGTRNGAYVLHLDNRPAGWFQNHRTGITGKWSANKRNKVSKFDRAKWERVKRDRQREHEKERNKAASRAVTIWNQSKPASSHPYLTKKRISPHCSRVTKKGALIIPLCNNEKEIVNLQIISKDGDKRFLKGGVKKGCFCWIGGPSETLLISEGFATAASLHEQTGNQVFIAFDAGNLESVAKIVRKMFPDKKIIIAGDNDESGIGEKKATQAAIAVGALVSIPPTVGHDWNDHINLHGVAQ